MTNILAKDHITSALELVCESHVQIHVEPADMRKSTINLGRRFLYEHTSETYVFYLQAAFSKEVVFEFKQDDVLKVIIDRDLNTVVLDKDPTRITELKSN
tara:strand:- start:438 stop:737 length:300 start_codon:yes stop_codon:yes gene_type:complete